MSVAGIRETLVLWHPLIFYFLLTLGDRMQNPYEYKLYYYNKISEHGIGQIYAAGAMAASLADIFGRPVARRVGWKISAALLLACLVESCLLKNSDELETLILSKVLSKVCLISIFPLAVGQFNPRLMPSECVVMTVIGCIGIASGIVGGYLCDVVYFSCYIMYRISAVVLIAAFCFHWLGGPSQPIKSLQGPRDGDWRATVAVLSSQAALWCCSTIVEINWCPLSSGTNIDAGILYSLFCLCHLLGGSFFAVIRMFRATFRYALTLSSIVAATGMFFCAVSTYYHQRSVVVAIMALIAFHFALGLQGTALRRLRSKTSVPAVAEAYARSAGRVAGALMILFTDHTSPSELRVVLLVCFSAILAALMPVQLLALWKKSRGPKVLHVLE
ncbi:unnamed protein product [Ixodes hexagonus]